MTTIQASYDTLLGQASSTIETYLNQAERMLNKQFGDGFAYHNPNLVGTLVQAMASDFHSATLAKAIGELADVIDTKQFGAD